MKSQIEQAIAILQSGGLVIFPTETVYGAGVDATNPKAVEKLLAFKSRREGKPLSIAVTDQEMAEQFVELNDSAKKLYKRFLPGPVTVVSNIKPNSNLAPGVASEFGTVGVRIPDYPLVLELIKKLGKPITATSANASGAKRPYSIADAMEGLSAKQKNLIDFVIDVGTLPPNEPSTVIDTTLSTPITMRSGSSQITSTVGASDHFTTHNETETKGLAGRLLLKHWNTIRERGLVIGLNGPLGAGKTIFTKGMAEFLGITETITSPTYNYIQEYAFERHKVAGMLYHLDVWKIDSPEMAARLRIGELIRPNSVVAIEWMEQLPATNIKPDILITFEPIKNDTARSIKVQETA
jgi:L-threonylcarbamoyladenylate synthase